jgi:homoserine kinase
MPFAVRVPASTSNLGAGFDCVGLAVDLWLDARLVEGSGPPRYGGTLAVVAGLALADLARGTAVDRERLLERATAIEGHPDNVGPAIFGGLFLASQHPNRLNLASGVAIALAIPEGTLDTHTARERLPQAVPREVAIAQASRAAALVLGLTHGDPSLIAYGMEDQLAVPHRKSLIAGFERAVEAGTAAGAYGVTISGAGSALLALCSPDVTTAVARAMAEALTQAGNPATPLTPAVAETGLIAK